MHLGWRGKIYGGVKNDFHFTTSLNRWMMVSPKAEAQRRNRFGENDGRENAMYGLSL